ncbi:MAG: RNA methyltransferase [Bergeyella sp.]|nr:RNA methyltransferase [Bergeyella sp.]
MLSAHKIKILQSLDKKKFRQKYNLFLVEGNKALTEVRNSDIEIVDIFSVHPEELKELGAPIHEITEKELKKISFLSHPKDSVGVCKLRTHELINSTFNIVLDGIQDPGNLGTIIRLADWFGIEQIICSADTVDLYNPKVIQSSMGSFTRVNVTYKNLNTFLAGTSLRNIGTDKEGKNIYSAEIHPQINLIMGNEGNGIRNSTQKWLHDKLSIPRFGKNPRTESLNVAIATSIVLGEIFSKKTRPQKMKPEKTDEKSNDVPRVQKVRDPSDGYR